MPTPRSSLFAVRLPAMAVAALLAAAGAARGQEGPQTDRPGQIEEAQRVLPRVDRPDRVVMPTRAREAVPPVPGLTGGRDWADEAGLRPAGLPEGSFLIERPGRIIDAPMGRKIFVPTSDEPVAGEGPMLIMPTASLERLEIALRGGDRGVRVSGEVFVYHGRSYLLMTSYRMGEGRAEPVPEPAVQPEPTPEEAEAAAQAARETEAVRDASLMDDPAVRGLLEELEAARPVGPSGTPEDSPAAADRDLERVAQAGVTTVPDGTPIVRRRGRLVRTGEGAWAFVFDNDTDDALAAESMLVMPCLLLQRMERQAMLDGDAFELLVSGRVHTHDGTLSLLPTMMLRVPVTGLVPMR